MARDFEITKSCRIVFDGDDIDLGHIWHHERIPNIKSFRDLYGFRLLLNELLERLESYELTDGETKYIIKYLEEYFFQ